MLRRRPRRGQEAVRGGDDPLDAAQERRVRAVLALGGVPQSDLPDGVQQVRLRLLERAASGREAPRDVSAWARWVVGEARVAAERAWISEALPGSRDAACPSGAASSAGQSSNPAG